MRNFAPATNSKKRFRMQNDASLAQLARARDL